MNDPGHSEEFVFCGACGTRIPASVSFCTSCGESQAQFADSAGVEKEQGGEAGQGDLPADEGELLIATRAMEAGEAGGQQSPPPGSDAPGAMPNGPGVRPGVRPAGERGFFESLIGDTKFESLITPKLVQFAYVISMIVLGIGAIVTIAGAFAVNDGTGVLFLFIAPLVALLYLIGIRLWLELIVVAFRIRDAVEQVADNTRHSDSSP